MQHASNATTSPIQSLAFIPSKKNGSNCGKLSNAGNAFCPYTQHTHKHSRQNEISFGTTSILAMSGCCAAANRAIVILRLAIFIYSFRFRGCATASTTNSSCRISVASAQIPDTIRVLKLIRDIYTHYLYLFIYSRRKRTKISLAVCIFLVLRRRCVLAPSFFSWVISFCRIAECSHMHTYTKIRLERLRKIE